MRGAGGRGTRGVECGRIARPVRSRTPHPAAPRLAFDLRLEATTDSDREDLDA